MQTGAPNHPLAGFPEGEASIAKLCERVAAEQRDDAVANAFCAGAAPLKITNVLEMQAAIGLGFETNNNQRFAFIGTTASLATRGVNAMVPRLIMFSNPNGAQNRVAVAYSRGEQAFELIARDNQTDRLNFYFAVYKQDCSANLECGAGNMLTPETEANFTQFSIYPSQDIENTQLDCNACHLVNAAQGESLVIFRMQELQNPWTHFFRNNRQGGIALLGDFQGMHAANEAYAGVPGNRVAASDPAQLENFVRNNGFGNQPNEFRTGNIEGQVRQASPNQPANNDVPGTSATWTGLYQTTLTGANIPVPYHDVKATDSAKVTSGTAQYQAVIAGTTAKSELADLRDAFFTERLFEISMINVDPSLKGQDLVNAACTQCHRSQLNQTITRSRFNADLAKFSNLQGGVQTGADRDRQLRVAITRVNLPAADVKKMPPERLRTLQPAQIQDLTRFFCSQMETMDAECQATMATAAQ